MKKEYEVIYDNKSSSIKDIIKSLDELMLKVLTKHDDDDKIGFKLIDYDNKTSLTVIIESRSVN